ncbi:unnamed protein product [Angiostrongylus costaricensis]|uniref:Spermatogenesis associated 6 n=1 Tax=Angiostrongylus costaricensis TaxID=334426 RepID=A0A0R3PUZ2_ANGCS|nr:unnamed protein product [Angiostrongylus costaricensis]
MKSQLLKSSRIRQKTRRVPSNESEKYSYTRARSMDRNESPSGELRTRLISPEPVGDYTYVNYHDSSNGRPNGIKDEKRLPRSILKNKQVNFYSSESCYSNYFKVFDRLRRHLSLEKSASPQGQKRSLLSFNRRRTSEVRVDPDGRLVTNGCDDAVNYNRPNSPMDKIKSLFRKNDAPNVSSGLSSSDYYAGRSVKFDVFDLLVKLIEEKIFQLSWSRDPSSVLNRYSYTPGMSDQRRHWYDDHNMY